MSEPTSPLRLARALQRLDPADGSAIADVLRRAEDADVILELREGKAEPAPADAWLLAWCTDLDGCSFYAVPSAVATEAQLDTVAGACFANGSDVFGERLGVLIRLIAGMEFVGNRTPENLAAALFDGWHAEFEGDESAVGIHSADDLVPLIGWLNPYALTTFGELARPFAKIVAVNRAC